MGKREIVKGLDAANVEISLAVVRPDYRTSLDAQLEYNRKVAMLVREGKEGQRLLLRSELESYLESSGAWTRDDKLRLVGLQKEVTTCEMSLRRGGIRLLEARELALRMSDARADMMTLFAKKSQLDSTTIEAVAENHKFNFLVTRCLLTEDTGQQYMVDALDWEEKATEPVVIAASARLAALLYGLDEKLSDSFFENKWLKQAGFLTPEGRLTDRTGRMVDRDMRLVNENGRLIDAQGNLVDRNGNRVSELGEPLIQQEPFIDDVTGESVSLAEPVAETKENKPRKKRSLKN